MYEVGAFIGKGGMGEVYKALDRKFDRPVALKLLPAEVATDPQRLRRFRAEVRAASSLNHPHILVVHDFGELDGRPFMVTELVEGQSLRQRMEAAAIPLTEAVGMATQVASALAAAHARGIVHRDIKPENVMLRPDGYVKVLDFGLARHTTRQEIETLSAAATETGALLGTPRYMSPEQSRGEAADPPSDVFSLGLLLFEMVAGRHPFHADSTIGVLHGIQSRAAGPSGGGPEIDALLGDMLQKGAPLRPAAGVVAARLASLAARTPSATAPLRRTSVGREGERALLRAAFDQCDRGEGRLVAVTGEPGIGKSTLVEDFLSEVAGPVWIVRGRCSQRLAGAEAHLPFLEALDSLLESHPPAAELMKQLAPSWYVQIAPLPAGDSSAARLIEETKSGSPERLMREMAALLQELARERTLLLFIDDLHWADVSTVDLLAYLAPKLSHLRALFILTYRPTDLVGSGHPLSRLLADLVVRGTLTEIPVTLLTPRDVEQYVAARLPEAPAGLDALIFKRTEGNPLFMVDLVGYLRGRGAPSDWEAEIEREIPESLRGMIERKLEGLRDDERQLLRVAAVQGFQFDSAIVAQVLERDPADVEEALQSLDRAHGLVKVERELELPSHLFSLRCQFVHVLYQNALLASGSPSRKASWSGLVARALETAHGERKNLVAAELAVLYEMARDPGRAAEHFLAAAQVASTRFANREAAAFAERGLSCLAVLPDNAETRRRELELQKARLIPLGAAEGYGTLAVERVAHRIAELAEELEDDGSLFAALGAAALVHMIRAECAAAARVSERMLAIADQSGSDVLQMTARMWATNATHHLGRFRETQRHAEICVALGTSLNQALRLTSVFDPVVATLANWSRNLWIMGDTRESRNRVQRAVDLAREIRHPESLAFALLFKGWSDGYLEEWEESLQSSGEALSLCRENDLVQTLAWNRAIQGWATAHAGNLAEGLEEVERAIADMVRIWGQVGMPQFLAMLAEVLILRGEHERALGELQRILAVNETSSDRYFDAELHRLAAECHVALGQPGAAEDALQQAIDTARSQEARTFELRATTALARLWSARGEKDRARALLQPVCDAFRNAEEAPDLRRARTCLMESS
jgi:tetratricopeptide (TPR) repeat protein